MLYGCHISIRKGYLGAAHTALNIGARSFQYFPKNPRSLSVKSFDRRDAEACAAFCKEHGLFSIGHTAYPTNLAVDDPKLKEVTKASILNDLEITESCGSIGLVVHFGKYKGKDPLHGYKNILQLLNELVHVWNGRSLLLIENQAGDGSRMGMYMEEMVQIRNLCDDPEKIGFCLDSCHAFASGMWSGNNWNDVYAKGMELGYFDHVKAVHLNDSMFPSASYRDRHANVGKGYIGESNMLDLLRSPFASKVPIVLETPSAQGYSHQEEIEYLNRLHS